jgi:hypothetical protein
VPPAAKSIAARERGPRGAQHPNHGTTEGSTLSESAAKAHSAVERLASF